MNDKILQCALNVHDWEEWGKESRAMSNPQMTMKLVKMKCTICGDMKYIIEELYWNQTNTSVPLYFTSTSAPLYYPLSFIL